MRLTAHSSYPRLTQKQSIGHGDELIRFPGNKSIYFNFDRDVMFLSSRFLAGQFSTETTRLRGLSTIIDVSRLRRVVVTYAGTAEYEDIGRALKPFRSLKQLYVAELDRWGGGGLPHPGRTAHTIEAEIERFEAEETDDEEESDEDLARKLAVRYNREVKELRRIAPVSGLGLVGLELEGLDGSDGLDCV